ncbi:MAG TPA: FAD-binding protein, partial [Longimicrobiales bacterium]|nr:FAD-binding protein [Longimicrobiales bacterium]
MEANAEVLVIGGGIAGAAAALSARAAGRQVAVVRAGPGSTALTGGAWVGDVPEPLSAALAAVGYVLHPVGRPLAHPTGELYPADFAPPEHAGAVVDDGTLICGVSGLPAFHAPALARLWGDTAGRDLLAATVDAGQAPASGWSVPSLAATLERNPDRFVDAVARAVREADARRVILPAVLGIEGHDRVRSAIEQATGAVVAEALGTPPSLPGWRLDRALLAALERAGIHVHAGRAGSTVIEGRRVSGIRVAVAEDVTTVAAGPDPVPGSFTITADAVVLATGKFLGGGIRLNGDGLQEPAL